jgi:RNA polymerase sigma factor (sigma-70 family)
MTNYDGCSDEELVAACREGTEAAWNVLVGRYERLVYTVPLRYGLGRLEADDVYQAVWITLLKHLPTLEQPARISAWLVTTAKHECWQRRRGADFERSSAMDPELLTEGSELESESVEEIIGRFERHEHLGRVLQELDERCRRLLHYLYYDADGLSYEEIGRSLNMPPGAIGPTRARCLRKLRELLEGEITNG